ncbi:MAG TPA: DUF3551 domain-containing protein [Xanthobacteraceae bacterium]
MRLSLFVVAVLLGTVEIGPRAQAQDYPWCAIYAKDGDIHCFFTSLEQCMATVSGIGGFCQRNTTLAPAAAVPNAHKRRPDAR